MWLILLWFSLSFEAMASNTILESSVVGCPGSSQVQYVTMKSYVDIQKSYLDKFAENPKERERVEKHAISGQLKYLVGIFKEFHNEKIIKTTFSHYQSNTKITKLEKGELTYPEYDVFWPKERGAAFDPYIVHLMKEGPGKKEVVRVHYEVDLHTFSCMNEKISPLEIVNALNELPFPKDPFTGMWVNSRKERFKEFNRPDCFTADFALFGVPEQAWFFWSPVQFGREGHCKIKNKELVLKNVFSLKETKITKILGSDERIPEKISGSIYFGVINEDPQFFVKRSMPDFSKKITETFEYCKKEKKPLCLGKWNEVYKIGDKHIEPGASNFVHFLKFLSISMKVNSVELKEIKEKYLIMELGLEGQKTKKTAKTRIYYGPTSLYEPLMAPKEYWKDIYSSIHEDDFLFYIGHAGLGTNLQLETMKKYSGMTRGHKKRNKPLYFGIFNCEALTYFGFDYEDIFQDKKANNLLYLISSSGVEVNSLFTLSYLDFLLNNDVFVEKKFNYAIHDYVQSRDFLGFQKINFKQD